MARKKTGARRSGDPRKRSMMDSTKPMFWQPFRHACGCYLAWGIQIPHVDQVHQAAAQKEAIRFLSSIKDYPCPLCGSATGVAAEPLAKGSRRYMPACNAWYMHCPEGQLIYADRLADHVGVPRPGHDGS